MFEELYRRNFAALCRFAERFVGQIAEEVVQDAFASLWEMDKKGFFPEVPEAYLFRWVKNRCIDLLRRKKVQKKFLSEQSFSIDILEEMDDDLLLRREEMYASLRAALDSLPPKCKQIYEMHKLQGRKQKEIARDMGLSVKTVEAQIASANEKIKIILNLD